jgi:putative hydrolase of the HAD superfamily
MLVRFPYLADRVAVPDLVQIYRQHPPAIGLPEDVAASLTRLSAAGMRLGIVTDGTAAMQAAKVRALGLERWCSPIILTDRLGVGKGKPHPAAFETMAAHWGLGPGQLVYVGDNPRKDFIGPRRLGWMTVRLRRQGQLHADVEPQSKEFAPDLELASLEDLARGLDLGT